MAPAIARQVRAAALAALLACASACATGQSPALIAPDAGPQCQAALAAAASELAGKTVILGPETLRRDSVLVLAPRQPRDEAGQLRGGRELDMPVRLQLKRQGEMCSLHDSQRSIALQACSCKAAPQP
ncbi:MAG TPA: hypothetical protein VIT92_08640 [Burkholderiaceae bacterium]